MYYKEQGKKVSSKTFRENFSYDDNKPKYWMWWLLGILFAIAIVLIIIWMTKKNKPVGYKFF